MTVPWSGGCAVIVDAQTAPFRGPRSVLNVVDVHEDSATNWVTCGREALADFPDTAGRGMTVPRSGDCVATPDAQAAPSRDRCVVLNVVDVEAVSAIRRGTFGHDVVADFLTLPGER
ncbi:hypothetical protein OG203_08195 [Nocardia sp. NBC_01499]|uniref:hypothetical protein n=1 Tax=Nocardia sp. NBC_01499 TaxID=2903597 RepID=UPI00386A4597